MIVDTFLEKVLSKRQIYKLKGRIKGLTMTKKEKRRLRKARKEAKRLLKNHMAIGQTDNLATSVTSSVSKGATPIKAVTTENKPYVYNHYTTGYTFASCKHGATLIAQFGDIDIYAGTRSEFSSNDLRALDVIVNCSQTSLLTGNGAELIKGHAVFDSLQDELVAAKELWLDWQDGGAWLGGLSFWQKLHEINLTNNFKSLAFCCFGGHGRTGTSLAAYLISNAVIDVALAEDRAKVVVKQIRESYCNEAIETKEQLAYLIALAEEKIFQEKVSSVGGARVKWFEDTPKKQEIAPIQSPLPIPTSLSISDYDNLYMDSGLTSCEKCKDLKVDCSCDKLVCQTCAKLFIDCQCASPVKVAETPQETNCKHCGYASCYCWSKS